MLIAFIILDNPAASLLDMRTVSFVDGKPVFAQVRCGTALRKRCKTCCRCTSLAAVSDVHTTHHTVPAAAADACIHPAPDCGMFCASLQYLDTFPFPFYVVLRDIAALPATLADLLRQWFQLHAVQ